MTRLAGLLTTTLFFIVSSGVFAQTPAEKRTEAYFDAIKSKPTQLAAFIRALPKGGDLHNHESGATYAENLLKYGYNDNLCVDRSTFAVYQDPHCQPSDLLDSAVKDNSFKTQLIDAWSMKDFVATDNRAGHDHFFATFGKFGAIAGAHHGEILAEIAKRAASENELYLELMTTADGNESGKLGKAVGWNPDFATMRANLFAAGFEKVLDDMTINLVNDEAKMRTELGCITNPSKPACELKVRYLYQVQREQAPEMVFAQLLAGFEGAIRDHRIVGINMVQPEDGTISMRDYELQMQMIGYLHQIYPQVNITLHAGELNDVLVPADGLKFHIRDAIEVAHAKRIGHGVDVASEDNYPALLIEMAQNHNLVEINLSSNAEILNISGANHPLPLYLKYGVPVTLSTDDEGVSRGNLTKEYERAVTDFNFDYLTLKMFSRNSLQYSFMSGNALWQDYDYQSVNPACANDVLGAAKPSSTCQEYLDSNEKANMQWELERRFNEFEAKN